MWWFGRRRREERDAQQRLLETFLNLEQTRLSSQAQMEDKRAQLQLRELELNIEHAEALAKSRAIEAEAKATLRQKQREWSATYHAKRKAEASAKPRTENGADCPVCAGSINLTAADIAFHTSGHTNRNFDLFS
jgi:hypothetical protein